LLAPRRRWWIYLLVGTVVPVLVPGSGYPPAGAALEVGLAALGAAQALAQAWLLRRGTDEPFELGRVAAVGRFALATGLAVGAGSAIASLLAPPESGQEFGPGFLARFAGQALSVLVVTPLGLAAAEVLRGGFRRPGWRTLELIGLLALVAGLAPVALAPESAGGHPLGGRYFLLLPLLVAGMRHGLFGTTLVTALAAVVVSAAGPGARTLHAGERMARVGSGQLFVGCAALTGLLVAAAAAGRRRTLAKVAESEARFQALFSLAPEPICLCRGRIVTLVNPAFARTFGTGDPRAFAGRPLADLLDRGERSFLTDDLPACLRGDGSACELRIERPDGTLVAAEATGSRLEGPGADEIVLYWRDLTRQSAVEREVRRANRALRALSLCHHALIHAGKEVELVEEICRTVAETGGYRLAWVGYAETDDGCSVRRIAAAGAGIDYLEGLDVRWSDTPAGRGPMGTAIRTGTICLCRDIAGDVRTESWRERAGWHRLRSSLALPLLDRGRAFGALLIYSAISDGFDEQEIGLLRELADDLAYGIIALRGRERQREADAEVRRLLGEAERSRKALLSILEDAQIAEAARRRSEALYRDAINESALGLTLVGLDHRWVEVNPAFCRIIGYAREEVLGRAVPELTHPDDVNSASGLLRQLFAGELRTCEFEKRYVHRSGRPVWVNVTLSLMRTPDGQPQYIVNQVQDITARRLAEASLAAATDRLALALKASRFGIWQFRFESGELEWDARMFEIFGLPAAEAAPALDAFLAVVVEEDRDRVRRSLAPGAAAGQPYHERLRVQLPGGGLRHVELQGIVQGAGPGAKAGVIGVAGDITGIVEGAAETERLRGQLLQSQKMEALGNLAAGVAHDFNNLLTGINGFVELASGSLAPGHEAEKLLAQARKGSLSARDPVKRILNYARSGPPEGRGPLDLADLVRETAPLLAAAMPANVSLALELSAGPAPMLADAVQFQQVLMNLCTNAVHAIGRAAGRIELGLRPGAAVPGSDCRWVELWVRDNGCGMDQATQGRIFERFFTTKEPGVGTGLGLAIVQDVVKAHGGRLEVESAPGAGTTFSLHLPLSERTGPAVAPSRTLGRVDGRGRRVMVVDDEPAVAVVAQLALQKAGFAVTACYSAPEAWDELRTMAVPPDLLVTDQNMPDLSGLELAWRARERFPDLPVVLMSGRFEAELTAEQAGTLRVLAKPFDLVDLVALAGAAVRRD